MAFKEYTKCVQPKDFLRLAPEFWQGVVYIGIGVLTLVGAILLSIFVGGTAGALAAIAFIIELIYILRWWLYGRLICLGDDPRNCAIIGKVTSHGSNPGKKKLVDNDYTMNLLLANRDSYDRDIDKVDFDPNGPQDYLFVDHDSITDINLSYASSRREYKYWQGLHIEFEGDGVYRLYLTAIIALELLIAALLLPFPLNLIAALIALLVFLIEFIRGLSAEKPNPTLETPLDSDTNGTTVQKGSVVVLQGEWIYDGGHDGSKNEIHPVRSCMIIGELGDDDPWSDLTMIHPETGNALSYGDSNDLQVIKEIWCDTFQGAEDAEEGGNRDDPVNEWGIHPEIDGCREPIVVQ